MEGCGCIVLILLILGGISMLSDFFNFLGENALPLAVITVVVAIAWKFYKTWRAEPSVPTEQPRTDPRKDAEIRELSQKPVFLTVAILAKFAKADGVVTPNEISTVEDILRDLQIIGEDRGDAIKIFSKHKLGALDYPESLELFDQIAGDSREWCWIMCVMLMRLANADNAPSVNALRNVQLACEILDVEYSQIQAYFREQERQNQDAIHADFNTLGCSPSDSIDTIKKQYRDLTKTFHPDALNGKDLHPDILKLTTEKWRKIQEAYERILERKSS